MIQRESDNKYHVYCDCCECELGSDEGFGAFYEALEAIRYNDWHSKKEDNLWINICPECFYK